nr:RecName: Full=Peroxidase 3 [Solanum lycopersicum]
MGRIGVLTGNAGEIR